MGGKSARLADVTSVLGLDGCRTGWIGALWAEGSTRWHYFATFAAALDAADVVAVDIPVGLPRSGPRACDLEARRRLPGRGSSVFPAPVRAVLAATDYREACDLSREAQGKALSKQAWAIVPKITEVDRLRDARRVLEVHPEVSFAAMTGRVLPRKASAAGAFARMQSLTEALGPLPEDLPEQGALDDCLDALACLWTGRRWVEGTAEVLGGDLDEVGQVMRIVV